MTNEPSWEIKLTPEQKARLVDLLEQVNESCYVGEALDEYLSHLHVTLGQVNEPAFWCGVWEQCTPQKRVDSFDGVAPTPANGLLQAKRWLEQIQQQLNVYNNLVGEIRSFLEEVKE